MLYVMFRIKCDFKQRISCVVFNSCRIEKIDLWKWFTIFYVKEHIRSFFHESGFQAFLNYLRITLDSRPEHLTQTSYKFENKFENTPAYKFEILFMNQYHLLLHIYYTPTSFMHPFLPCVEM